MTQLSPVAIKSLISGLGYTDLQVANPTTYYVFVRGEKDMLPARNKIFPAFIKTGAGKLGSVRKPGAPHRLEDEYVEVSGIRIYIRQAKTKKTAKNLTFGRENEANFHMIVNDHLKEYGTINIEFQVNGRTEFIASQIVKAVKTGKNTANRSKSDVDLFDVKGKKIPISLKGSDAAFWESPDTYWGETAKRVMDYSLAKNATTLQPEAGGQFRLSNAVAIRATRDEAKDLIFGNDIYRNGAVIKQTWSQKHVKWDANWNLLILACDSVVLDLDDLDPNDFPYFQIRNHSGKKSKHLYPGLALVATRKELTKNDAILPDDARRFKAA